MRAIHRIHPRRPPASRCSGLAYLAALFLLALVALIASTGLQTGTALARRDAETHLLAIGREFQDALRSYTNLPRSAVATAGVRGPRTLEELLRDPRVPGLRRHLRQVHTDPLTGQREWGLVRDRDGFIVGIYSLAPGQPIKQAGFDPTLQHFEGANRYADWVFGFSVPARAGRSARSAL